MVNNSTNINKTNKGNNKTTELRTILQRESLSCDWSTILPILTTQKTIYAVMVVNSSNINKSKESLNSDGQQFYQYQATILPISKKQKKV